MSFRAADRYVKGCYAVSVTGKLPAGIVRELKGKGIHYRSRDTSLKAWLKRMCIVVDTDNYIMWTWCGCCVTLKLLAMCMRETFVWGRLLMSLLDWWSSIKLCAIWMFPLKLFIGLIVQFLCVVVSEANVREMIVKVRKLSHYSICNRIGKGIQTKWLCNFLWFNCIYFIENMEADGKVIHWNR